MDKIKFFLLGAWGIDWVVSSPVVSSTGVVVVSSFGVVVVVWTMLPHRSPGSPQIAFWSLTQARRHESKNGARPCGHSKTIAFPFQQR
jgi:hypothetical protein